MVRPHQLLHPQREPVLPRPAATVLLLRDSPHGIEVLMTRRSLTASFEPGAYVFPGGGIDALDAASHAHALRRATQGDLHLTQAIAAIRESFEELGILWPIVPIKAWPQPKTSPCSTEASPLQRNVPLWA